MLESDAGIVRIAIVSDIHANLPAFEALLAHAGGADRIDALWCLGDTVGYGPHPNECVTLLRTFDGRAVAGNHDLAACGKMGTEEFNEAAAQAAHWTARELSDASRAFLEELPLVATEDEATLVHGSLRWPEWEYLLSSEQAQAQFELQRTPVSLVGHSHIPFTCAEQPGSPPRLVHARDGDRIELGEGRWIVNPGGAGQPRDGDPRASYALYDSDERTVTHARVEYDIAATQRAMEEAGLPRWLIERLSEGR
jgi:diadenosine tetraphosphatase ApaH/serine/threonine PP2A family protein phosphatase